MAVFRRMLSNVTSHHVPMFSFGAIIRRVWSYGGLRSSPLSRNRELMQRIARIGYLMPGVICKCRGRLAPRRNEEERGACPSSPSVFLAFRSSFFLLSFASREMDPAGKGRVHLCNALWYAFLLLLFYSDSNPSFLVASFFLLSVYSAVPTNK